jgi:hypothetical protein
MSDTEIQALITLIDDPDEVVYHQVRDRIISLGEPVVPSVGASVGGRRPG